MLKPLKSIKSLKHQSVICKERFNVLCWNVAKLSQKKDFKDYFKTICDLNKLYSVVFLSTLSNIHILQSSSNSIPSK